MKRLFLTLPALAALLAPAQAQWAACGSAGQMCLGGDATFGGTINLRAPNNYSAVTDNFAIPISGFTAATQTKFVALQADGFSITSTNSQVVGSAQTLGGSVTVGDTVGLRIQWVGTSTGDVTHTTTVIGGDTLAAIGNRIAQAFIDDPVIFAANIYTQPPSIAGGNAIQTDWPAGITPTITSANGGGATETWTFGAADLTIEQWPQISMVHTPLNAPPPAAGNLLGNISWGGPTTASAPFNGAQYAMIQGKIGDPTDATLRGRIDFATAQGGSPLTGNLKTVLILQDGIRGENGSSGAVLNDVSRGVLNFWGGYYISRNSQYRNPGAGQVFAFRSQADDGEQNVLQMDHYGSYGAVNLTRADGTAAARTQAVTNDLLGSYGWSSFNSGGFYSNNAQLVAVAAENQTNTAHGANVKIQLVRNGTTTLVDAFQVAQDLTWIMYGTTSGSQAHAAAAIASGKITWPAGTVDFSGTGGTSQVVKQTSAGGIFTVGQLAFTDISGTAAVTQGGTGAGTFTSNGVLYGNGTSAIQVTAAGTTGQVLLGVTGSAPVWGSYKNIIAGANSTTIAAGTTAYLLSSSASPQSGTTFSMTTPFAGTFRNMYFNVGTAPGVGQTYTATLYVGTYGSPSATAVTCQISGGSSTSCSDTTHSASITAGQAYIIQVVASAGAAGTGTDGWSVELDVP